MRTILAIGLACVGCGRLEDASDAAIGTETGAEGGDGPIETTAPIDPCMRHTTAMACAKAAECTAITCTSSPGFACVSTKRYSSQSCVACAMGERCVMAVGDRPEPLPDGGTAIVCGMVFVCLANQCLPSGGGAAFVCDGG